VLRIIALTFVAALSVLPQASYAAGGGSARCTDVSVPKKAINDRNGRWIELTSEQWEFLRGIYAMNPLTPPGLPYGDKAVLAQVDGDNGGLIFFIDGDRACTPMPAPSALVDMIRDVATDTINHEGGGL
jgi:hypothetical protein